MQVDTAVTLRASLRHLGPSHILPPRPSLHSLPNLPFAPFAAPCVSPCWHHRSVRIASAARAFPPRVDRFGRLPPAPSRSFVLSLSLSLALLVPSSSVLTIFLPAFLRPRPSAPFTHLPPSSASIPYRSLFPFSASQRRCDSHVAAAGRTACAGAGGRRSCIFPALGRCVFGTFGVRTSGAILCQAPAAAPRAATVGRSYDTP